MEHGRDGAPKQILYINVLLAETGTQDLVVIHCACLYSMFLTNPLHHLQDTSMFVRIIHNVPISLTNYGIQGMLVLTVGHNAPCDEILALLADFIDM